MLTAAASRHESAVAHLAETQSGVASRAQLARCGVDRSVIRNQVQARRWRLAGPRVVLLSTAEPTLVQKWWIAVLNQPPGAALAGVTAACAYGLQWLTPEPIHVIVADGVRPTTLAGVKVHVSRRYNPRSDVDVAHLPPSTRIGRSVIDAAAWGRNDRQACGVMAAAVQQRLVSPAALSAALKAAGTVRRGRLLRLVLGDLEGGAQSFAELDLGRVARRAGLPPPLRQEFRRDRNGRRRWLDAGWRGFKVEADGMLHMRVDRHGADLRRQNDLMLGGDHVLHYSSVDLRLCEDWLLDQLREAARVFGV